MLWKMVMHYCSNAEIEAETEEQAKQIIWNNYQRQYAQDRNIPVLIAVDTIQEIIEEEGNTNNER